MPGCLSAAPQAPSAAIGEIVPPEILAPPMPHERRWLIRDECALLLDGFLRRLARQEALCRRVLGRVAAVFLSRRAHHRLGFARLGDYARERLGLSAREVQSLAQVVAAMERLPKIAAAFERAEISWSRLRLLVAAATPATEDAWLTLARGRTVRALDALRKKGAAPSPSSDDRDGDSEAIDGEPRARFRSSCPRAVLSSWRRALELAERMAGEPLPVWRAVEAIAAEALSSLDGPSVERSEPDRCFDPSNEREPEPAEYHVSENRDVFGDLDWSVVAEAIPESVEALARDLEVADPFTLDQRMRTVLRSIARVDWQLGRLLRLFLDMRLHQMMGFVSASRYVRERLEISVRKARALVHLERRCWKAPELASAYRGGEISWLRALTILPVAGERYAGEWVERATSVTVRRLVDEVEWALETRDGVAPFQSIEPPPAGAALVPRERQTCARAERLVLDCEIAFSAPASVVALLRAAISGFAGPADPSWKGLERLLDHVIGEWESQPRHRDPVFAREGWRCAVPACSSRRNLHDHHILFRSRGGDNGRENRVAVCAWHHLRGLHSGVIRARGEAPDGITWEIGSRSGGGPLLRLEGERYAEATPRRSGAETPGAGTAPGAWQNATSSGAWPRARRIDG